MTPVITKTVGSNAESKMYQWVATAGWDAKVFLYRIANGGNSKLGEPVASIALATNPETVTFIQHPDLRHPILLVTRRDSTSLHYYPLPVMDDASIPSPPPELKLLGTQNLAPHSNAWIAFSPSSVAICPTDPTLLAVATSAVPHMVCTPFNWFRVSNADLKNGTIETYHCPTLDTFSGALRELNLPNHSSSAD